MSKEIIEIIVPSPGESITEVEIANWLKKDGEYVEKDEEICEIDSDKATLTITAEEAGKLSIKAKVGDTVEVGSVLCSIDTSVKGESKKRKDVADEKEVKASPSKEPETKIAKQEEKEAAKKENKSDKTSSPLAKKMMQENNLKAEAIQGTGSLGKITKGDVVKYLAGGISSEALSGWGGSREERREKMSSLRRKIAQRLVSVKNETAMLTTFNEVDMSGIINMRQQYKERFKEKQGIGLGFMSFFTKAITEALHHFPAINAMIDGEEIVFHDYADIGIAVSSPKGLMVPVLRNAEQMSFAEIEKKIKELAIKARDGKITIDEMTGGTFTITNGGVFGSMLSTPIINPPQSAILGMHNIVERPVAIDGKVEIRPIMYVALSYDHRIIDGKESVSFLVKVKEMLEDPAKMIFGAKDPGEVLLGL